MHPLLVPLLFVVLDHSFFKQGFKQMNHLHELMVNLQCRFGFICCHECSTISDRNISRLEIRDCACYALL